MRPFFVALLGALVGVVVGTVPQGYKAISQKVCSSSGQANIGPKVPRVTAGGAASSDLGSYSYFTCTGTGTNRVCSLDTSAFAMDNIIKDAPVPPKTSLVAYAEGVFAYTALNIVLAVLIPLFTAFFLIFRYMCGCFCAADKCTCMRCGAQYPTQKKSCGCGCADTRCPSVRCCGFQEDELGGFSYSALSRIVTHVVMIFFMIFAVGMFMSAEFIGNQGLTKGMQKMADANEGVGKSIANLVRSAIVPTRDLAINIADTAVAPFLVDLNGTLTTAINVPETYNALTCVNATFFNLPNITTASVFVTALNSSLSTLRSNVVDLQDAIVVLNNVQSYTTGNATLMKNQLTSIGTTFSNMNTNLGNTADNLANIVDFKRRLIRPYNDALGPGLLTIASNDITAIGTFPSSTTFSDAAGPLSGNSANLDTVQDIISGGSNGNPSAIKALVTRLDNINSVIDALPNYNRTAQALTYLNANITLVTATNGLLDQLSQNLNSLQTSFNALPTSSTLLPIIDALTTSVYMISLDPLFTTIRNIRAVITTLPDFNILLREISKIRDVKTIVPCLLTIGHQVEGINATMLELPAGVANVATTLSSINATLSSALASIETVENAVYSANYTITSVNITVYLEQVRVANSTLLNQRATLDTGLLRSRIVDLGQRTTVNFNSLVTSINNLRTTLQNSVIPTSAITGISSFQVLRETLDGVVDMGREEYTKLAKGYCLNIPSQFCDTNADCGGNTCSRIAQRRCVSSGNTGQDLPISNGASVNCNADSDCSSLQGGRCLGATNRATRLKEVLTAAADPNAVPNLSSTSTSVNNAITAATNANVDTGYQQVTDAQTSIVQINTAIYIGVINNLLAGFSSFDTSGISTTLASIKTTIDGVPFNSFDSQLKSMSATVGDFTNTVRPIINGLTKIFRAAMNLFFNTLSGYVTQLHRPALMQSFETAGLAGVLESMAMTVDNIANTLIIDRDVIPTNQIDLAATIDPVTNYIDKASGTGLYTANVEHGPLYYLGLLFVPNLLVAHDDELAFSVFTDTEGFKYSGGRVCLTANCLKETFDGINLAPISKLDSVLPFLPDLPVPLSRENIFLVLWVFPILTLLLALWGLTSKYCCASPSWQKVPTSCMVGSIICQLPCIFLIIGFLFPMVLILSDACASGVNIGYNYVLSEGDALCGKAGGVGTADECVFGFHQGISTGHIDFNVSVNIPQTYGSLLGKCPAVGTVDDVMNPVFDGMAEQIRTFPIPFINDLFRDGGMLSSFQLRPRVKNMVVNTANATAYAVGQFVEDLGDSTLSCTILNAAINDVRESVCCNIVTPLFWYVSAWYLLAWSMLLCGLPVGCLGRKRLPDGLWGPGYDLAVRDAEEIAFQKQQEEIERELHGLNNNNSAVVATAPSSVAIPVSNASEGGFSGDAAHPTPKGPVKSMFGAVPAANNNNPVKLELRNVNTKRGAGFDPEMGKPQNVDFGVGRASMLPNHK